VALHPVVPGLALLLGSLVALSACAPRQAIVESEPGRGTPTAAGEATLRSDLLRLASAQEDYETANGYYAARATDLGFTASAGVRIDVIQGDRNGWSAVASSGDAECGMYEGDIRSPRGYLTEAGTVMCR
jgi:hypothetical protein